MFGHMDGYDWGGMGTGMVVWWIVLAAALALLVRFLIGPGRGNGAARSARETLDARYARGEIGREEYEQMKRELES